MNRRITIGCFVYLAGALVGCSGKTDSNTGSSDGSEEASCTAHCDPCPEGERRFTCDYVCVCELEEDVVRDEHERLLACDSEQPCAAAGFFYTANAGNPIYSFSGSECLFAAFRDRTAGRFDFTYDGHAGFGVDYAEYSFLLDGSDHLLMWRSGYNSAPTGGENDYHWFAEVESCTLGDPSMYDACLTDPDACMKSTSSQIPEWFRHCVVASEPSCGGEGGAAGL